MRHGAEVRLAFKQLDKDRSGTLTYSEFRAAVVCYGYVGDPKLLFDAFDLNRNGWVRCAVHANAATHPLQSNWSPFTTLAVACFRSPKSS